MEHVHSDEVVAQPPTIAAPPADLFDEGTGSPAAPVSVDDLLDVPAPPAPGSGRGSRKRPCGKQQGRRHDRARQNNDGEKVARPRVRKLNRYFLDPVSGRAVSARPGVDIPTGARVVEQPPGHPAPTAAQFFDLALLPEGSTIVAQFGFSTTELDPSLVARFGRIAGLAGVGRQARKTHLDVIGRSTDPTTALRTAILALGGDGALDCDFKELSPAEGVDRVLVASAIKAAANAGNTSATRFVDDLPTQIVPAAQLSAHLTDLPGRIVSVQDHGKGCRVEIRCHRFEDMQKIADALRAAGGRRVEVDRREHKDESGRPRRTFTITGEFAVSSVEFASARTGTPAVLEYSVDASGRVVSRYRSRMFDQDVVSPEIPAEPSRAAVRTLLREVDERFLDSTNILASLHAFPSDSDVFDRLFDHVGPVRTLDEAVSALEEVSLDAVVGAGASERWENRHHQVLLPGRREVNIVYRDGAAVLMEESYHVTDRRILELPDQIDGPGGPTPTLVRELVFTPRKGSGRPKLTVKETPVAEIKARRSNALHLRDRREAVLAECRENVVADVARSMAVSLAEGRPDGSAKSRARNKHVEPVLAEGGSLVALVSTLAADPEFGEAGQTWSKWCGQQVARYRNLQAKARSEGSMATEPPAFWSLLRPSERAMAIQTVEAAAQSFLAMRFGREVSLEEVRDLAAAVRSEVEQSVFTAFDRARAVHATTHRGVSLV